MDMNIGFLGAGKMATAIARGLLANQVVPATALHAVDPSLAARQAFAEQTGVVCGEDALAMLEAVDLLVLAVKPQVAAAAIAPLAAAAHGKLVVSIAAGLSLARLAAWFGHGRIVRVMPNTPAMVGLGAAVFAAGPGAGERDRQAVRDIFAAVGVVREMPEECLDAVTALSGSGPAYVFELIRTLVAGAVELGLGADDALLLTAQTVAGAARMVQEGMGSPEELRNAVTSPGGTTAAGLAVLAQANFPDLIANVLQAARDRSRELGAAK